MKIKWLGWKYALLVVGVVVLAFLVMDFNTRMTELRRLRDKHEVVAGQVTGLALTQEHLETQIAYAASDQAVMEWAYQEGRMARDGDIPIIPLSPAEVTPVPTLGAAPTVEVVSPWQVWWALFFDR
ncbi:MAG: hypothetical protein IBX69_14265 [Anaerolineales bacterium]|nr:hypothetical protein [Anaerolineales bacterium]